MEELFDRLKSLHFMSYLSYAICVLVYLEAEPDTSVLWAMFIGAWTTLWVHLMGFVFGGLFFTWFLALIHNEFLTFYEQNCEWVVPSFGLLMLLAFVYR
ncbi:hypothetical protein [Vibrio astriarenae]|uniref:hypothetical protein n=1 Tax=Vibrio astriarenae TaxID=1481923 RepID=UPI0037362334